MRKRTLTATYGMLAAVAIIANIAPAAVMAQEAEPVSTSAHPSEPLISLPVPVFVSREVVQKLPEPPAEFETVQVAAEARTSTSLAQLVALADTGAALSEQMRCLAGAVYFEARGEPLYGQLAVAKVVINRSRSGQFPKSYCGVVYQRSQFSFVRGGAMPRIREDTHAWRQAKAIARIAHDDTWDSAAEEALYFHANYVRPSWAKRRVAAATINRHIFYR